MELTATRRETLPEATTVAASRRMRSTARNTIAAARRMRSTAGAAAKALRALRPSDYFDALTATASVADMVTDIAVLVSFYRDGLTGFFVASLCTLLLAQCSFACLFCSEHTKP